MSSFCWTEIWARCASKAVDSRVSSVSIVSATRIDVVGDVAEERRGLLGARTAPSRWRTASSARAAGCTARRTSASSRLRM